MKFALIFFLLSAFKLFEALNCEINEKYISERDLNDKIFSSKQLSFADALREGSNLSLGYWEDSINEQTISNNSCKKY